MSRKTRRRRGPVLVLVTLLLAAGAFVLWTRSEDSAPAAAGTPPATTSARTPPAAVPSSSAPVEGTEDDRSEEVDPAEEDVDEAPSSPPAAPGDDEAGALTAVAVSLSYTGYDAAAGAVVAGGYADGVLEEDATCTLVLSRDGVELRGESLGTPSAATTDCGEVRVGGDALTSGTWEAVLGYTSETSTGTSAVVEVEVP